MAVYMGNKKIGGVVVHINETGINPSDATLTSGVQMLEGVIGYGKEGKVIGTIPSIETQTITPMESEQSIAAGQYLEGDQKISAIPSTYVGSAVPTQDAKTVIPSTSVQTAVSSGTYITGDIKVSAMPNGALSELAINTGTGVVTAGVATSGYLDDSATKTMQLETKGATTIVPTTSSQTAVAAGIYTTGDIIVSAMKNGALSIPTIDTNTGVVTAKVSVSGYLDTNATEMLQLPTKSASTITPSTTDQTINAGQYLLGAQTIKGDANLVSTNVLSTATIFGVQGSVVTQDYYVGDTDPSTDLGKDGDLYFKRG